MSPASRPDERRLLFIEAAARKGIPELLVEKDFWFCWWLSRLYALDGHPQLLFKGGTSLSKGFGTIQRFSEDIDLGIERGDLGLDDDAIPHRERSRKANARASEHLRERVHEYVRARLVPGLRDDARTMLGDEFDLVCERDRHDTVVHVRYPRALDVSAYPSDPPG